MTLSRPSPWCRTRLVPWPSARSRSGRWSRHPEVAGSTTCLPSIRAHVVALTDLDTVVAQDGVGGCDVEEELRQAVVQK
eukprot:11679-Eustigmatos_ZCMA.PRE.1